MTTVKDLKTILSDKVLELTNPEESLPKGMAEINI